MIEVLLEEYHNGIHQRCYSAQIARAKVQIFPEISFTYDV